MISNVPGSTMRRDCTIEVASTLIRNGKLKTVAIVAVARELAGFIWAVARAVTNARVAAAPA